MMGLREKQSNERKQRILNVADALIRQTGGTEFSMRMLAEMAKVSPATPYNLFGSKDGVLSASLARSLSRIVAEGLVAPLDAPVDFVIAANRTAVSRLVDEKALVRPLYQYLLGVVDPVHRPTHIKSSLYFWRTVAETAMTAGQAADETRMLDYDALTYILFSHFLGLLELWIHQDIEDDAFMARAIYGSLLIIGPLLPVASTVALQEQLVTARLALEEALNLKLKKKSNPKRP